MEGGGSIFPGEERNLKGEGMVDVICGRNSWVRGEGRPGFLGFIFLWEGAGKGGSACQLKERCEGKASGGGTLFRKKKFVQVGEFAKRRGPV